MSGFLAVLKGATQKEDQKADAEPVPPQQSKCIRIGGELDSEAKAIQGPQQHHHQPNQGDAMPAIGNEIRRSKQAETSAEVRLISALVFSLYQIKINDPAVLCTATAFCLTRDCPRWRVRLMTGALAKPNLPRLDNVLVVQTCAKQPIYIDFEWRERYRLRRTVQVFDQWFNSVSPVMVAPEQSLVSQIRHNSLHCRNCFLALGMEIPPWRRPEALISAYLSSSEVAIDVRPLCGYLMETLPDADDFGGAYRNGSRPAPRQPNGRCDDEEVDTSEEDGGEPFQAKDVLALGGQCSPKKSKETPVSLMQALAPTRADSGSKEDPHNDDAEDADGSSGEGEGDGASPVDDGAKYVAPPVLTALTETYANGKHSYMCVEYSAVATEAVAMPQTAAPKPRAVLKGTFEGDSVLRKRTQSSEAPAADDADRKEVAMAELLAEPNMQFLLDLDVQKLVEQTGTNPDCVIKAVPPYPFTKEEMKAAGMDQLKKKPKPGKKAVVTVQEQKGWTKPSAGAQPAGRQAIRSLHQGIHRHDEATRKGVARSVCPQKMKSVSVLPVNSMPQPPLVWGHVDNRPIYAPALTDDLRQLLVAHVPSSYIPHNQSFSKPMYHLVNSQNGNSLSWSTPTNEDYSFEKSLISSPGLPEVSGLTQQLSTVPSSPPRRFAFWW